MRTAPPKTKSLATGGFEVQMSPEPPYSELEGVTLARASFEKRFVGALEATSTVQMLGARTPVPSSAGYVALERIEGSLNGLSGSFVLVHMGLMHGDDQELEIRIVPNSGTGQLAGITGTMVINNIEGKHSYAIEFDLP